MTVDVVVLGAGPAGLAVALLLSADGHRVTVLDRDPAEPAAGDGRGVSQFRQPHVLLPRGLAVLERQLPEVVAAIEAAGGLRWNVLAGARAAPDRRYEAMAARRPVVEAALCAVAARTPNLGIRRGVGVSALLPGSSRADGVPHVRAVATDDGETLEAGLVVDASGGGSPVGAMVNELRRLERPSRRPDAAFDYYSRFFRSADGTMPAQPAWPLAHHDSVSTLALPGDNGSWSLTLVVSRRDWVMRSLYEEHVWHRAAALFPGLHAWLSHGEPVTGVLTSSGPATRRRDPIDGSRPPVTGLVSVGDAWGTTNPTFCQGMSMALVQAELLREVMRAQNAPEKVVLRYEDAVHAALGPFYDTLRFWERNRLAEIYAGIRGRRFHGDDLWTVARALEAAKLADPDVMTAMGDLGSMLATPEEVLARPGVVDKALAAEAPASTPARAELLAAITR
ncbi:FAD-dependent oxidoreductase [Nonomuraea sp. SYSU D8015]|uniref:FAD-dependent oxidoreductase n=1 Tax=Nonomuraea sp. SYSU D8015 TaxID=2593644 RepID=UPI0016615C04|nr:FAD-dependent oxidoreductase [Nonomuraea sp. SYSU D8015]